MNIKTKLVILMFSCALIPSLFIGYVAINSTSEAINSLTIEKLQSIADLKSNAIKNYFNTLSNEIIAFSNNEATVNSMKGLSEAYYNVAKENEITEDHYFEIFKNVENYYKTKFESKYASESGKSIDSSKIFVLTSNETKILQNYYIVDNANPIGKKEALDYPKDKSTYSKIHQKFHPSSKIFLNQFSLYDIFLVEIETGNIIYSVFKELDFGTSLTKGPYADTNLAEAFNKAKSITNKRDIALVDYKSYLPSYDTPASFVATPIWDEDKKIGVAIFQIPIAKLNDLMLSRDGIGKTGESYLVGSDYLLRSDTFFNKNRFSVNNSFKDPEKNNIKFSYIEKAINGEKGEIIDRNYDNKEVLISYSPIDIFGLKWVSLTSVETEEAFALLKEKKITIFILVLIFIIISLLIAIVFANSITKNIQIISEKIYTQVKNVNESSKAIMETSTKLNDLSNEQSASLHETVTSIDEISAMVERNAQAAKKSADVSQSSTSSASKGKKIVEDMINSINEIAGSNDTIMIEIQKNNHEISNIVNLISEIGEKTKVINDIVFQTKLLSFNASIEAARAGEHGKGFAVVATEVGNLASMSGQSALEITEMLEKSIQQVKEIVNKSGSKVESLISEGRKKVEDGTRTARDCEASLDEILTNTNSVNEMVHEIAVASKEQSQGVKEVNIAMQQFDVITQQSASIANQSAELSINLKNYGEYLGDAIHDLAVFIGNNKNKDHNEELDSKSRLTQISKKDFDVTKQIHKTPKLSQKKITTAFEIQKKEIEIKIEKNVISNENKSKKAKEPIIDDSKFEDF